ncbi:unnamed protein product [Zymoseptoria tritici ST99CH_1E4]|uniref:Pumilio homology domain family member 3 n=2 Tax=Zymoseptoria tritici TaxID=1047171 RepID=A0A2H1FYT4_ZYMTR|nr:unnamed protein product [Zymoseptoria tritici ST99CH_1E4]
MVFANHARAYDSTCSVAAKDDAESVWQPRSFTSVAKSSEKSSSATILNPTFGGRGNAWGSSSIWSGGISSSLALATSTRENSVSRDTPPSGSFLGDVEGKTGSGSLVESSISDDYPGRPSWSTKRSDAAARSIPNARYTDASLAQQRTSSNAGLLQGPSSSNGTPLSFASRPPAHGLNTTTSTQTRPTFGTSFSAAAPSRGSEQPPFNVYTKFDRPPDPMQRKPDSAIGSWADTTTTPSPSDERRPQLSGQFSRTGSMPVSRDGSDPPSRHGEEQPIFTRPDYSRPSQRDTPNESRAPSVSSRNGAYGGYYQQNADQMMMQFGQLNVNGDARTGVSYRTTPATNGRNHQAQARGPVPNSSNGNSRFEDVEEIDRSNMMYFGLNDYPGSQRPSNQGTPSNASFAERFLQSGSAHEFRPGQPYQGNAMSVRSYDSRPDLRSASEWQGLGNGSLPFARRSPGLAEHQAYLDPRIQQFMAAQLRSQYAAMYNPYMPSPMQLHVSSPYLGLAHANMPGMDGQPHRDGAPGEGVQSALMYEFKSNTKTKRYELRDIYDHIAEFSGDQHGSRFIQTKLETANSDEKERVFREIEPNAIPLMTDVFGNYVIQKFFEHGDQTHKKILANKMKGQVLQLSLQMYGCRVVQKALDHVLVDQQAVLIGELEGNVIKCVKDQNGNHVIQKAIERCPPNTINFITNAFRGQVQHLSIHSYGCRVIQRCLEKCDLPAKSMIMAELLDGIPTMISDQYGNYVVQHIVQHDDGEGKRRVLQIVGRGLEGYSKHKFASNVVEKCLERADDSWRRNVVLTLGQGNPQRMGNIHGIHIGDGILVNMIKDNFGNYVIQKLLDTLAPDDYHLFLEVLQPAMIQAKRTGCGKQVLSIDKKMHRFDPYHSHNLANNMPFDRNGYPMDNGYQMGVPIAMPQHQFASNYNSAATTPPPLTADTRSLQSSGVPSINGDTMEGASSSRKGSDQGFEAGLVR